MTNKSYTVTLSLSESGKIMTLTAHNGRLIGEFYVEGPLHIAAYNAANNIPMEKGRVNIYRGDIQMLERNEYINKEQEYIEIKSEVKDV